MDNKLPVAYIREYESARICEFIFNLEITIDSCNINQEVKVNQPITNAILALVRAVEAKVKKLFQEQGLSENAVIQPEVSFFKSDSKVKEYVILQDFMKKINSEVRFQIFDKKYQVYANAPLVKQLKLPSIFYPNLIVQPIKFNALFTDKDASQYFWYRSQDKITWKKVGKGFQYEIKEEDIGHFLKFFCILHDKMGIAKQTATAIADTKVEHLTLPKGCFEERHKHTCKKLNNNEYRVVSYNILSERYVNEEEYYFCEPKHLCMDYRKLLLMEEIAGYNADIVCLQEVDNAHFSWYFDGKMKGLGYGSVYNRKGNRIPEGLACFYNMNRLGRVESKHIVLSVELQRKRLFSYMWEMVKRNADVREELLRQNTSLQVNVFRTNAKNRYFIVANTHLYYHPDANHIRLIQINMATTYLNYIKNKYMRDGCDVSVIFCGDFNSSPEKSVVPYMTTGKIHPEHEDVVKIAGQNSCLLYHSFLFQNASGTPPFTNYTPDFKGCLDYIFIEANKLEVIQNVPFISEDTIRQYEGLPNEFFPSDHLALVTDVKLRF